MYEPSFRNRSCTLPFCFCSPTGTDPPLENTTKLPQFILITIDGAVNTNNFDLFQKVLHENVEFPILSTFFIEHGYSDYYLVEKLYAQGKN